MLSSVMKRRLVAIGIAPVCALFAASYAHARGAGGILGNPATTDGAACFRETNGGVTNQCSTTKRWVIPLIADNSGSTTVQLRAAGTASGRVCCTARSFFSDGSSVPPSPTMCTGFASAVVTLPLPLSIPGFGAYAVTCEMPTNTRVLSAHY